MFFVAFDLFQEYLRVPEVTMKQADLICVWRKQGSGLSADRMRFPAVGLYHV